MIRLTIPSIEKDDLEAVCAVLETGYLIQGARVADFENAVANYVGTDYAVAVSNGTSALHLALLSLNVQPGDFVLVTAYSWIATANVIELCGAQPVFIDIQADTFNLDPDRLESTLSRLMANKFTAQRVKAILPVHTFGQMADMPAILALANEYDIPVIEDAACALGATLNGQQAGSWGVMGCFSFHPRKAITTGEGGIVTTNDETLAHRLRTLRNHGFDANAPSPDFIRPGFNYRMTEFQAALGLTQINKIERIVTSRQVLAANYDNLLTGSPLQTPIVKEGNQSVYQSYVTLLPENKVKQRAELIQHLRSKDIETTIGTLHMPMTSYFQSRYGYKLGDFNVTDAIFARSLTLPLYESLSKTEQSTVVETLLDELGL